MLSTALDEEKEKNQDLETQLTEKISKIDETNAKMKDIERTLK